jgi:hypothetical protein
MLPYAALRTSGTGEKFRFLLASTTFPALYPRNAVDSLPRQSSNGTQSTRTQTLSIDQLTHDQTVTSPSQSGTLRHRRNTG